LSEKDVTILKSKKDIEVVAEAADGKETCVLYNGDLLQIGASASSAYI
jgi:hypothetical protein